MDTPEHIPDHPTDATGTTDPGEEGPLTLRARTPEDLLAMVPVMLGFEPEESVTMLTFGPGRPFHARLDLPREPDHVPEVADALLAPALEHDAGRVVLVLHARDPEPAETVALVLQETFDAAGVDVLEAVRADGSRWYPLHRWGPACPEGVAYDVSSHPFLAAAVLQGRVVFGSRAELAASLSAVPERVEAVRRELGALADLAPSPDREAGLAALVDRAATRRGTPEPGEVARLLAGLCDPRLRDAVLRAADAGQPLAQVRLWSQVVTATPPERLPWAAALLAYVSWQSGNGALAWCALDLVEQDADGPSLAVLVRAALEQAVPPSALRGRSTRRRRTGDACRHLGDSA